MSDEMMSMKEKPILPSNMILSQLEDALEERQTPDRRKLQAGLPTGVDRERRKGDRRSRKKS